MDAGRRAHSDDAGVRPCVTALLMALVAGCASSQPSATALSAESRSADACDYLNVFVVVDESYRAADPDVEWIRQLVLAESAVALSRLGPKIVFERSEAYWRLHAEGWSDAWGNVLVHVGLQPELKLGRDMFAVLTAGEPLPYRGGIGSGYNFADPVPPDVEELRRRVEAGMSWIWQREAEQVLALCEVRARLIEEGWTEIDELREELIKEIQHVRRERARAQRDKQLQLEMEPQASPGPDSP